MTHGHRKGRDIAYEPPGGQSPRNTSGFYMPGHHAWTQTKVVPLLAKKFEKSLLSLQSPHGTEGFVKAEKRDMTCLEAASQSRRKASVLRGFETLT